MLMLMRINYNKILIWYVSRIMDHIIKSDVIIEFNRNLFRFRKTIQNLQQKKIKSSSC